MSEEKSLNRQVAEKLGYSIYHYDKDVESQCYYLLQDEDGNSVYEPHEMGMSMGHRKTEAEAWAGVPEFDSDIRLAMSLLKGRVWTLGRSQFRNTHSCTITPMLVDKDYPVDVTAEDEILEVAICKAFLQLDLETEEKVKELSKARQQLQRAEQLVKKLEDDLKVKGEGKE